MTASSAFPDLVIVSAPASPGVPVEPGLTRHVLAQSQRLMLVENHMDQGWAGARHSHPHEQLVHVISGHLRFSVGERTFDARTGDSFVIQGDVEHQAWALAPSVVFDVFTPRREEYL